VQVLRASMEDRKIDFRMVRDERDSIPRERRRK
jgi:hypothetical protein